MQLSPMTSERERVPAFSWPIRVYYEDTDAGGVVYHAAYLKFMERGRTEWLRALGFEQDNLCNALGVLFVVRRMDIAFKVSARFNDLLTVNVDLCGRGGASLNFVQTVVRDADRTVCCSAGVNVVCVDAARMRPKRIPEDILEAIGSEIDDGV
jgi:acyl-CoA thioester hydrolase